MAQAPHAFNYQTVVRNSAGAVVATQGVNFRFSIHDISETGMIVYEETQSLSTNSLGLVTCAIGNGSTISGTIGGISWSSGAKYLQVEIDPTGGNTFTNMGVGQLLSVPYALYAGNSGGAGSGTVSGTTNYVAKFTNSTTAGNSQIFDDGTNVGIGTTTPTSKLQVESGTSENGITAICNTSTSGFLFPYAAVSGTGNANSVGILGVGSAVNSIAGQFTATGAGGTAIYAVAENTGGIALLLDGEFKVTGNKAAFIHTTSAANTSGYITTLTYTNPLATDMLFVTHNFGPLGGMYLNKAVGVYWNGTNWNIFNEDATTALAVGTMFNVLVIRQ